MYLYHIKIIQINLFHDTNYWNNAKNNLLIIFIAMRIARLLVLNGHPFCLVIQECLMGCMRRNNSEIHQLVLILASIIALILALRDINVCLSAVTVDIPRCIMGPMALQNLFLPSDWVYHRMICRCLKSSQLEDRCSGGQFDIDINNYNYNELFFILK